MTEEIKIQKRFIEKQLLWISACADFFKVKDSRMIESMIITTRVFLNKSQIDKAKESVQNIFKKYPTIEQVIKEN